MGAELLLVHQRIDAVATKSALLTPVTQPCHTELENYFIEMAFGWIHLKTVINIVNRSMC